MGKQVFPKKVVNRESDFSSEQFVESPLSRGFPAIPQQKSPDKLYQQIIKSNHLKLVFMCADYKSEYKICFKSIY